MHRPLPNHLTAIDDNINVREQVMYVIRDLDGNYSSLVTNGVKRDVR